MVPPPTLSHSLVVSRLIGLLGQYMAKYPNRCALFVPRAPVWTVADTYLEPDLFLISTRRLKHTDPSGFGFRTADLVVEVLSPSTAVYDRTAKADTYAALGVRELWLADLEARTIEQRILRRHTWRVVGVFARRQTVKARVFSNLAIATDKVFM
jgi:Uma2 family endonuclease